MAQDPIRVPIELQMDATNAKAIGDAVSQAFGEVSKTVTALANGVEALGKGLPALLNRVDTVAKSLKRTIASLDTGKLNQFSKDAREIGTSLNTLATGANKIKADAPSKLLDLTNALEFLQGSVNTSRIYAVSASLNALLTSINGIGVAKSNSIGRLTDSLNFLDHSVESLNLENLTSLHAVNRLLGNSSAELSKGLTEIGKGLSQITSARADNIQKLSVTITNLSNSLGTAASKGFLGNAIQISAGLQRVAASAKEAIAAQRELLKVKQANEALGRRSNAQVIPIEQPRRDQRANRPPPEQAAPNRGSNNAGFLGTSLPRVDEILPQRGPIVQVTGLLFLLQGAAFGMVRVFDRLTNATLGANIALEKQVISLQAITGSFEEAQKVVQDFAIPFAANVPFFESGQIIDAVNRLAAEGFGVDEITGRLEAGFNKFTGKFEEEFEGGLVKTLGSTAVAFGRTLDQSVDAFVSAIQGRFTKIRRFGIDKADLKAFGFEEGGSDRTNARALQSALDVRFGDLIVQQAETFTGAISNIQDVLGNISRAAFEFSFKRVRKELVDFVATLSSFEKAFSTALATEEEFKKKLEELDPITQRNAQNLRSISKFLGNFTDGLIEAGKFLSQFAPLLLALVIPPIVAVSANLVGFSFQKLIESMGKFLGIVDRDGKRKLPNFIQNIGKVKKSITDLGSVAPKINLPKFDTASPVVDRKVLFGNLEKATDNYFAKGFFSKDKSLQKALSKELEAARGALDSFDAKVASKNPFITLRKSLEANASAISKNGNQFGKLFTGLIDDTLDLSKAFAKVAAEIRGIPKGATASTKALQGIFARGGLTASASASTKALDVLSKGFLSLNKILVALSEGKAAGTLTRLFAGSLKTANSFARLSQYFTQAIPAANQVIGVFSTMTQRIGSIGGVVGNLGKLFGGPLIKGLSAGFSIVTGSVQTLLKSVGLLASVLGAIATTAISGFVGIFKFFLVPAIFETIEAVKDLVAGVETLRTQKLFAFMDAVKELGKTISATVNTILVEFGLFSALESQTSPATNILTKLLKVATGVVQKFREYVPILGNVFQGIVNLTGGFLKLSSSLFKLFAIFNQAIPILRLLGDAFLAFLSIVGFALDILTLGNTDFGSELAKLTVQFDQSFSKINKAIFDTGTLLDETGEKLKEFAKGANIGSAGQRGVEQVAKGVTDAQVKGFTEAVAGKDAKDLFSSATGGTLDKFFKSGIINFEQLGLDTALEPFLQDTLSFIGKNQEPITFQQLIAESPEQAALQLNKALEQPLNKLITKLKANSPVWGVILNTPELRSAIEGIIANSEQAQKTFINLRTVTGKVGEAVKARFDEGTKAAKRYREAIDSVAEREKERLAEEKALGDRVFDLQVSGASEAAIRNASKQRDASIADSFRSRADELAAVTIIKRQADQALQTQGAVVKEAKETLERLSQDGVQKLEAIFKKEYPGIELDKALLQRLIESNNPNAETQDIVDSIAKAYGGDKKRLDEITGFITRTIANTRELNKAYADQAANLKKDTELQKQLNDAATAAAKSRNDILAELNATLENQRNLISNNLELGKISSRQAVDQLLAIQRVRRETKGLEADTKGALDEQRELFNNIKRLLSDLDTSFQDTKLGDTAADTFAKVVKSSLQARKELSNLTAEQRRLPESIEISNKALTSQISALNAYTDAQVEARNKLIEFASTQASLRLDQQFADASSAINQDALVGSRSELLYKDLDAENSIRDVRLKQLETNKRIETTRQNIVKINAQEQVLANQQLQLEREAEKSKIKGFNRIKIQAVAEARLTKLVEAQSAAQAEINALTAERDNNLSTMEANEKRVLGLLKEQRRAAQDIAESRKNAANQVLDFRKKLLLSKTNREELTPQEEAGFLRAQISNAQTALSQAFTLESATAGVSELLDLYNQARQSGQFTTQELEQTMKTIDAANKSLGDLRNAEIARQNQEVSLREQNIASLRTNTETLSQSNKKLQTAMEGLTNEIKVLTASQRTLLPQTVDSTLLVKNADDIISTAREEFLRNQGRDVSQLTDRQNKLLAATSQTDFVASFSAGLLKGADNLKLSTDRILGNFKDIYSAGLETAQLSTRTAAANLKIVERLENSVKNLDLKTASSGLSSALLYDPLTAATQDLQRLKDVQPNPAVSQDAGSDTLRALSEQAKRQEALLTQIGNAMKEEQNITINLELGTSGSDDFEKAIVNALYERLRVNPLPKNDIR